MLGGGPKLLRDVVVSLPMRDGNLITRKARRRGLTVVSLPMRDGNPPTRPSRRSTSTRLLAYL